LRIVRYVPAAAAPEFAPMKTLALCRIALLLSVSTLPARLQAGEHKVNGRTFTLPEGFTIELAAAPPLVDRPITFDFDEAGRLYVADSSGSNDKVQKQLEERPHRILRLEDTDSDGRYDRHTVFADRMMFPEGTLWFEGSLYVSAPPSIWKLTDTDGDGVADQRVEWFQGKTLTGCANDLHGPYLGPDGWIYWCKGAFAQQTYERPGKPPFVTRAAHIFRARPDLSEIEPVMTGGMDNPVDVVFTPGGERIFTTTFFQHPGNGQRDGLIHAVYGGVYGKVHDVIEGHPRTQPDVMPVLTHLGAAAPCGLARYESDAFGPEYRDNLFATLFNMHKVTRHILTQKGATFTSRDEDFLLAADLDFHPTDVQEDADGSLVVADTGGWYKLCCPTSQLVKPDVLGGLYRVRRAGASKVEDARGTKLAWNTMGPRELADLLDDRRPAVRKRAIRELAQHGAGVLPQLLEVVRSNRSPEASRNAIWAATRIHGPEARALARIAPVFDKDESVWQVALHSASLWRDREAAEAIALIARVGSPATQRTAAEALGRIGDKATVRPLLVFAGKADPNDTVLVHALTYALIEIGDAKGTSEGVASDNAATRRAALIALDQMPNGGLTAEVVAPLLTSSDARLRETAFWIVGRHSEWGEALAGFLRDRLNVKDLPPNERAELERLLARFAGATPAQELIAERAGDRSAGHDARITALKSMAQSGLKEVPAVWIAALTTLVGEKDTELRHQAVSTARAVPLPKSATELVTTLRKVASNPNEPTTVRLEALAGLPGGPGNIGAQTFAFLREQLNPDQPVSARLMAVEVLGRTKLTLAQLSELTESLQAAGPLEVDRLLGVFENVPDEQLGLKVVAALKASPVASSLRVETIKPRLAKFNARVQEQAEALYAVLNVDAANQRAKLEEMLGSLGSGDARRGQLVFNGPKAACSSCHAIGYLGGRVGPDLTRIGQIRTERDLLESILYPSASFVRSFEPVTIATREGRVVSGVLKKDAPEEVVLSVNATEEAHIARDDIEEMKAGTVSVMPAGLERQLTTQELADLIAFLKASK
jgi:putative membrane-bound dehydrogenase-like protein